MEIMAILIIGEEILSLPLPGFIKRFAMKKFIFNLSEIMKFKNTYLFSIMLFFILIACKSSGQGVATQQNNAKKILPGAYQTALYLPILKNKRIAIVGNQTSEINGTHLIDSLLSLHVNIVKVFAPEHGFRGKASAGEQVKNSVDVKTGLPIISLYGKHKKPTVEDLKNVDIIIFDIQDVGARFYTYLSTLHYVMEAAAEQQIPLIVLDRPNPNSDYIDGAVMQKDFTSFVGLHPVPIVYAMTIGEYAKMINGEHWLKNAVQTKLTVIPIKNYKHGDVYKLPVKPSPNLPNYQSVRLYPSLCLFEGTDISVGRGTDFQFQIFGSPNLPHEKFGFEFTPQPNEGSKWPLHQGKLCYGKDLRKINPPHELHLNWLINTYQNHRQKDKYFNKFFNRLAGNSDLEKQIKAGKSIKQIKQSWQKDLNKFKIIRKKYLIYPDFE